MSDCPHCDTLAEALELALHQMKQTFADPDRLKNRLSCIDVFAESMERIRSALAAHNARNLL